MMIKSVLQLFRALPLINWKGVALVTHIPGKDVEVDAILAIEGGI